MKRGCIKRFAGHNGGQIIILLKMEFSPNFKFLRDIFYDWKAIRYLYKLSDILCRNLKIHLRIHKYVDPIVFSISLRKLSHWIVQMPLINCNFLQFFAKTCGCLQTTLSTRLIRKLNGPENMVSVKRTYQASTIKFWFLKSMQTLLQGVLFTGFFCHQRFQLPSHLKNKSLWQVVDWIPSLNIRMQILIMTS